MGSSFAMPNLIIYVMNLVSLNIGLCFTLYQQNGVVERMNHTLLDKEYDVSFDVPKFF